MVKGKLFVELFVVDMREDNQRHLEESRIDRGNRLDIARAVCERGENSVGVQD